MLATATRGFGKDEHEQTSASAVSQSPTRRARCDSLSLFGLDDDLHDFMLAVQHGDIVEVRKLLADSPDLLNRNDNLGWTALMHAADKGHTEMASFLLRQAWIDVNLCSTVGNVSALLAACSRGHADIVYMLVKHPQIRVNQPNTLQWTPLMLSSFEDQRDCVDALLAHRDIDVLVDNCKGVNSLIMACMRDNQEVIWAHLRKTSRLHICAHWFSKSQAATQGDILRSWASLSARNALHVLRGLIKDSALPTGILTHIVTLAFGNELVVFGPSRGRLLHIRHLLTKLSNPT
ncbi:Ankyrin repeat and MYND domain-containing protein 2 [Hondaea fermentalgiana]|uniref:Ankyrin repeat and MYND domain-containing protein 2 n=1 Tax=Hondaea fermentalgiana TaxID=2315210 RepID=A0A2R5GMG9_9STRA|nr:Ankyrin repeat and MYND domain-containing protein 2 [Hondaea fermentalgiana]|eukprot:GBG29501.1 Ankyrin repeat and MYND domain-containing protein 2 [Hondaea fermentalgiana]